MEPASPQIEEEKKEGFDLSAPAWKPKSQFEAAMEREKKLKEHPPKKDNNKKSPRVQRSRFDIEISKQVEYYLSDKNLKKDEFFRKLILANPEGYVPLTEIGDCNAIKKLGVKSVETLAKALSGCKYVEVNKEGTGVRRLNNKPLPEFVPRENKIPAHLQ